MSEGMAQGGAEHHHPSYVSIWLVLLGLLVVSVLGPMLEIQAVTLVTAFGVAIVKAYLVVRYFMHVGVEPRYVAYLLATMVGLVALFFAGTAPDVLRHDGQQWANVAARAEVERASSEGAAAGSEVGPFDPVAAFAARCGVCHGESGAGDGPAAATLDPHPADFTAPAFWATRDRAHVARVVREGGAAVGRSALMPAFGAQLEPDQLEAIVDHVWSLRPAGGGEPDAGAAPDGGATLDAREAP